MSMPQDRVLRAVFWSDDKIRELEAPARLVFLWLCAVADSEGVAPFQDAAVLRAAGVAVDPVIGELEPALTILRGLWQKGLVSKTYGTETLWIWLPGLPVHQPRNGQLKPERDATRPAPPHEVVVATLRTRLKREPTQGECRNASPRTYGRKKKASGAPTNNDVTFVWDAWRNRQSNPDACSIGGYRAIIVSALRVTSAENLGLIIRWAYDADEPGPRWLRGENPDGRKYLGLNNLLVLSKIPSRMESALTWDQRRVSGPVPNLAVATQPGAAAVVIGNSTTVAQQSKIMQRWQRRLNGEDDQGRG